MRELSWKITIQTDAHDEDYNRHIRPSAILRYMQVAANTQLHTYGPTTEDMLKSGRAFILSSIDLTFLKPLTSYQTIISETWPCPARGYTLPRCYVLHDEAGEEVALGYSQWALVDIASHNILRANELTLGVPLDVPFETKPKRFVVPHIKEMKKAGTYVVTYAQTDLNHHLNNTYYPDMFANFVSLDGRRISHMGIRFLKEAPFGETLTIYVDEGETSCRFVSVREDGEINAEAEMTFCPFE